MYKVSVYIPVLNEEDKIEDALKSVSWADEVIIINTGCTDNTLEIARRYTDRIVPCKFEGFGKLRNFGIDQCTYPWILSIDADERCTPELATEIRQALAQENLSDAYWIPRRNWFMGRWIKHGDWYPDYCQPKLFKADKMRYRDEDEVHEGWDVKGSIGYLTSDVLHFSFASLSDVLRKVDSYSELGADKLIRQNRSHGIGKAFLRGLWAFIRIYILKRSFLDGWAGFVIALSNFQGTFYRHAKHAWKKNHWDQPPPWK
ncbi:MAG: glycosyltransferase family 2 protein [Zetaproteobacteria bacterium]|nr:glycosyltransferase family 2 protein [Zetaproteobacteria bacterium]